MSALIGRTLTAQDDGTTVIHGPVADQSALHGLLRKLGDLGLPLISVMAADDARGSCLTQESCAPEVRASANPAC